VIPVNDLLISLFAASITGWLINNPHWLAVQRYFMGLVRLMLEQRRSA
jgi:hypothetical protein